MDVRPTVEQELLRRTIREFTEAEIGPHVREWDEAQHFPVELVPRLGLLGIQIPERYGGAGMSAADYCICIEEIARVDPAVALSVAAHNGLCAEHIFRFGTEQQKRQYLVPLARGEKIGAWGLTESTSGSDAATMRTVAMRDGSYWILQRDEDLYHSRPRRRRHGHHGSHQSWGRKPGHLSVHPRIWDAGHDARKEGREARHARERHERGAVRELPHSSSDQLLGAEGEGFINAMQVLDAGRIGIAALAVGLAQGAYEATAGYAQGRRAFGKAISSFQTIQWKLADMATRIEAARLLTYRAAYLKDRGDRTTLESSMAKLYASETAVKAADNCVQIHGGYGFVKDYPAEKFFRDVKLTTIGEGTSEIQRLVIARHVLAR